MIGAPCILISGEGRTRGPGRETQSRQVKGGLGSSGEIQRAGTMGPVGRQLQYFGGLKVQERGGSRDA